MYTLFVFLIPAVLAAGPMPTPCCTNFQFEATLVQVGGYHDPKSNHFSNIDYSGKLRYDYGRKMTRYERMVQMDDGSMQPMTVITDYSKMMSYTYLNGGCTIERTNRTMNEPCIPTNAMYVGSALLGSIKDRQHVDAHAWRYTYPGGVMKTVVSDDDCSPMAQSMYGLAPNGIAYEQTYLFADFQKTLSRTDFFELPVQCHSAMNSNIPFGKRSLAEEMMPKLPSLGLI